MQQVAKQNEEWFVKYVNQNQGSDLPYHENLGITKKEYDEYFDLTE